MNVQIYSRTDIEMLIVEGRFPQSTAVISFCDSGTKPRERVNYSSVCSRIMYIELDDLELDELSGKGYSYDTFFPEADETAEFIIDAYNSGMNIICQCEYGQSRSAGCAAAIWEHFYHTGIYVFQNYKYYPNKLIYNKILDALNNKAKHIMLHVNTDNPNFGSVDELIEHAALYNSKAVAIIDKGTVRSFREADSAAKRLGNIKIIYGVECRLANYFPVQSTLVALAKNQMGLDNLHKLVLLSHFENLIEDKPYITKEMLSTLRNGLLVSSGNETGELYRAIIGGKTDNELFETARFYDYLEICPSMDRESVFKIIQLGYQLNIPVCASADYCMYLCERDFIRREIENNVPGAFEEFSPFVITEKMLAEFEYLGKFSVYDIVVKNTNLIANMIDELHSIG